ncbi:MAG TPA: T9SS type A sorting domain-containing protein, partial [Gemmatimonadota bacterium]|nr:T9SS type A sorting domain-containing protein [Gemmatimonadota bacterium]
VAFTVRYSSSIGRRTQQCSFRGLCVLTTPGGGGALPASVATHLFSRGIYGQYTVADIEVTWSNQNGVLGFSSVRDISNNVDMPFLSGFGTGAWGFSLPTGLFDFEDEIATEFGTARTDEGDVLFPDPWCSGLTGGFPGDCTFYGFLAAFTQSAPVWTDLPFEPNVFSLLAPFIGTYAPLPWHQPGAFGQTATMVNVDGLEGTRLWIAGQWLDIVFNQLPADGETWLIRLPIGVAAGEPPRPPVPGMAIRVDLQGGTSELADADLSAIKVVPNPFIAANEITRGRGLQRLQFTNLPPQATIRIYTISGNLVRVLEHSDGSGTEEWDVRTRFDLLTASGNYYYHVTTPDGRTHLGRFAVIN